MKTKKDTIIFLEELIIHLKKMHSLLDKKNDLLTNIETEFRDNWQIIRLSLALQRLQGRIDEAEFILDRIKINKPLCVFCGKPMTKEVGVSIGGNPEEVRYSHWNCFEMMEQEIGIENIII